MNAHKQTNRKREAEEASRMVTVVRDSNDAITIQDFEGRITAWNHGAELMYGYGEAEALAMNIERLTAPGKVDEQRDFVRRLVAGETITSLETQRVTKDGRILDVWMTVTKLIDDAGKPIGIASTERDITARKREEENLRRFATVVKDSNDALLIKDFEGRITAWNRGAELTYGYSEAEALQMNIGHLTPADKIDEQKDFTHRLLAGETVSSFETQRVTKDGHILDVWLTVTKLLDDAGKPMGIASTERDITERKRKEEALRANETRLNFGLETIHTGAWDLDLVDHTAHRTLVHDRIFGYEMLLPQWTYAMFLEHVIPEDRADVDRLFSQAIAAQTDWNFECRIRRTDGEVRWIRAAGTHERNSEDKPVRMAGIVQDITERKLTEEELKKYRDHLEQLVEERAAELKKRTVELEAANRELESFAYSVSHDLRAPLRTIDGFSQIIIDDYAGKLDEQGKNYLLRVKAATQKMGQLIDDMLKLSRITRQELKREEVDLSMMARKISAELSHNQPERQVEFVIKPGCLEDCDRQLIGIAIENLMENSWKYSSRHPSARIEFGAMEKDGKTVYFVRDDGAGFDPAYADKLFAPFQRLHAASEFQGNGIGLATIQRIFRKHGGTVWAEGKVEKGATFYFTLK